MILTLCRHETYNCFYFNCKYISPYVDESEYLFFGGDSILQIDTIKDIKNRINYQYYLQSINCLFRMIKGIDFNENMITNKSKLLLNDLILYQVYDECKEYIKIPNYILSLLKYHTLNAPNPLILNFTELREQYKFLKPSFVKQMV